MRLEWSVEASADLARIRDFNMEWSERWTSRVENRLIDRAESLLQTPSVGRALGPTGVRVLSVPDIQYVIHYRVAEDRVTILHVYSTREARQIP